MISKSFLINGVAISSPTACSWQLSDLSSAESGRSTRDGAMSKDIVAQKRTLNFTWSSLQWQEASTLAKFCKNKGAIVSLTYPDIMTGLYTTSDFYTGDMTAEYNIFDYDNIYITNITCSFVEV